MLEDLLNELRAFVAEREWQQFHSPQNLAKSISIEAGELLECYQWGDSTDQNAVRQELADVLTYCLMLADNLGFNTAEIIREKLEITRQKYPVEQSRGNHKKYDKLEN